MANTNDVILYQGLLGISSDVQLFANELPYGTTAGQSVVGDAAVCKVKVPAVSIAAQSGFLTALAKAKVPVVSIAAQSQVTPTFAKTKSATSLGVAATSTIQASTAFAPFVVQPAVPVAPPT